MTQVTISIEDEKLDSFIELLDKNGLQSIQEKQLEIPEWQKTIIVNRTKFSDPEKEVEWSILRSSIKEKYGF
jgi:hypothetical protein